MLKKENDINLGFSKKKFFKELRMYRTGILDKSAKSEVYLYKRQFIKHIREKTSISSEMLSMRVLVLPSFRNTYKGANGISSDQQFSSSKSSQGIELWTFRSLSQRLNHSATDPQYSIHVGIKHSPYVIIYMSVKRSQFGVHNVQTTLLIATSKAFI